jgi:hypothetical protein
MSKSIVKDGELWFICDCGFEGDLDALDVLGAEMGCCPDCGKEEFENTEYQSKEKK